jgi:hypothetical protein
MNPGTLAAKPVKTQYSVSEAAHELGLTVEQLCALIRSHIAETDEDLNNVPITSFHPSDLLVLKLLAASSGNPKPQGSEG